MFLERQFCVLSTFIKLMYIAGAQDVSGKCITERWSKGLQAQLQWTVALSAQLHEAASKAHNCHPTLENGKLKRSLVSIMEPLTSSASPAIPASWKKQRPREGESCELSVLEKMTFSYSSSYPHFPALLGSQNPSPPLYLPPTPSNSSGHRPRMQASWFWEVFRMWKTNKQTKGNHN